MKISLPAHSVVLIIGGRKAPLAEAASLIPQSTPAPWNVQKPDVSREILHEALKVPGIIRVCMPHSNAKARKIVASAAHKRGAKCVCIRFPDYGEMDATLEKIDAVYDVDSLEDLSFLIVPMPSDRRDLTGPFDIIGDIHGCADELMDLLVVLGYVDAQGELRPHPEGRIAILLGDLTDRGPQNLRALEIARKLTDIGGIVIRGNHDEKVRRWLLGKSVEIKAGIDVTIAELENTSPEWRADMAAWIDTLEPHLMLDGGKLAVAHAGIDEEHQGRHTSGSVAFAFTESRSMAAQFWTKTVSPCAKTGL